MKNEFEAESVRLRKEKDHFFKTDPDSPIQPERRPGFKGLNYFKPSKEYRVTAMLERFENPQPGQIVTSTGTDGPYLRYGVLHFELAGRSLQLVVYKSTDDPFARSLFAPFSDETSGSETYGSGRYLDLEEQGGDAYELDFNQAYNPYCAYNDQYTCPIPPRENKLPVKILAGEKKYK